MQKAFYLLSLTLFAFSLSGCGKKKEVVKPPPKVEVGLSVEKKIPVFIDAIGHFTAYNSAEIKAQVEGRLECVCFNEGDRVEQGDILFQIDPRPYKAKLAEAIAIRDQNMAKAYYAEQKVQKYKTLLPENFVAELDFIQYQTELQNLIGVIAQNEAEIALAEINLDYCFIKAPFSGITGKKLIDRGNLIVNNGEPLLVLNEIDPIYFDFSVPEKDFLKLSRYRKIDHIFVEITFPEYPNDKFTAKLMLIDNKINKSTGMLGLRAEIQNPHSSFWPGQFMRAKMILTYIDNALVIPEAALGMGQKGRFVYVIDENGSAEYRDVQLGEHVGKEIQVTQGLKPGEKVVTNGIIELLPGVKVEIVKK